MAILGVLARLEIAERARTVAALERIEGVTPFSIGEAGRIGMVVEAGTLEEAHTRLLDQIQTTPGVLGTWPVFAHAESESAESPAWADDPAQAICEGEANG